MESASATRRSTFVVRLDRDGAGHITGVVELVRTGQKQRISDVEGLVAAIHQLLAGEPVPDLGAKASEDEPYRF